MPRVRSLNNKTKNTPTLTICLWLLPPPSINQSPSYYHYRRALVEEHLFLLVFPQKLPIIAENCPACFEAPKERQRIKQLLAQQELLFPRWSGSLCLQKTWLYTHENKHKKIYIWKYFEHLICRLYWNLKTALYPVLRVNKTGMETAIFGKQSAAILENKQDDAACTDEEDI